MNWVLQFNNSQSVNSFNSLLETFNVLNSPNQPNPNPNQSVIDRGNLRTQKICLLSKGETSRSHEIDEKGLHEELGSSDRSCKEYFSYYRKLATETVYLQPEQQHEQ